MFQYRPYVSVEQRRLQAAKEVKNLTGKGKIIQPVKIDGQKIAHSFWGKAWCENLERYSDYASRLPRGRSYVRNGSVVDLAITKGKIEAQVLGSEMYTVTIGIGAVKDEQWSAIRNDCTGGIASLVELLQGKLSKGVMERVAREGDGLFPAPQEITLKCSCYDWADMCKHVAAVMYGIGHRLDAKPELLFALRGVEAEELVTSAGAAVGGATTAPDTSLDMADGDMAALFGLEMAVPESPAPVSSGEAARAKSPKKAKGKVKDPKKTVKAKTKPATRAKAPPKLKLPPTKAAAPKSVKPVQSGRERTMLALVKAAKLIEATIRAKAVSGASLKQAKKPAKKPSKQAGS
jgi:uncharacterized Zn finger protein